MRVLQEIYGDAASDVKAALTNGHVGPGGQLSEAVLRDYHFYGHAAAGRLAIATERATAILRGGEGVKCSFQLRFEWCHFEVPLSAAFIEHLM